MNAGFKDEQPRILSKERLPCKIGIFTPTIPETCFHGEMIDLSKRSFGDQAFEWILRRSLTLLIFRKVERRPWSPILAS